MEACNCDSTTETLAEVEHHPGSWRAQCVRCLACGETWTKTIPSPTWGGGWTTSLGNALATLHEQAAAAAQGR